jgi:hypothetical protein
MKMGNFVNDGYRRYLLARFFKWVWIPKDNDYKEDNM